jgi:hypothetical protein
LTVSIILHLQLVRLVKVSLRSRVDNRQVCEEFFSRRVMSEIEVEKARGSGSPEELLDLVGLSFHQASKIDDIEGSHIDLLPTDHSCGEGRAVRHGEVIPRRINEMR